MFLACSNQSKPSSDKQIGSNFERRNEHLIIGERIDGPANIRETANGKILFELLDSVSVISGPIKNNWLTVGLWIDLTTDNKQCECILPGEKILMNSDTVGTAIDTVQFWFLEEKSGFVAGETHVNNVLKSTIPEVYVSAQINKGKVSLLDFNALMAALEFEKGSNWGNESFQSYYFYESLIVDPSPMERISLLFKNDTLVAICHSRPLELQNRTSFKLDRGYTLSITGNLLANEIDQLIGYRTEFMKYAD